MPRVMRALTSGFTVGLLAAIALATARAVPASAQQGAPISIRVAYDGFSMTSAPLLYGTKQGIFRRFGLDVNPTFVAGGSMLSQAVVGGSVDIAQNGYTPATGAAVQGADIVIVGGISNRLPYQLVVKSAITDALALKGQSIAISRYGSSTDAATDFALAHLGLTRNDVRVLQLGGAATRLAAAMSGQIAGTIEQYPDTAELAQHGFHVLVDVTDIAGDYPNTSYVTRRTYLKAHPDIVKSFLMAMATAVHEYKTNPAVAIPLTQKFLDIKDEAITRAAYEAYRSIYPDDLRPSLKGLQRVLDALAKTEPKAKALRPDELVDTTALDDMRREGFFSRLLAQAK